MTAARKLRAYQHSVTASLVNMGAAFGYTITIWGSGALGHPFYGLESRLHIICYVGGAFLGILLPYLVLLEPRQTTERLAESRLPAYGFLHLFAIPAGMGAAYLTYLIVPWSWLGYLLGGYLASLVFVLVSGLEVYLYLTPAQKEELANLEPREQ